jgi:uncharacterized membrane protein SpoIIM required for sporulation/uncharacterized RDD family membrane protein YckC
MQETVTISTPDHVDLEFDLAGLGSRFAAHVLDTLCMLALIIGLGILALVCIAASGLATTQILHDGGAWGTSWVVAGFIILLFLLQWGYFLGFEALRHGQTPGKRWLGIRVLRDNGLPVTWRAAALRNLVRVADMLPPPSYLLAGVVMHVDPHGRRLGDMLAGTVVVRERFVLATDPDVMGWGAMWMTRLERGQSSSLMLPYGKISAAQLGLIEQFLQRRHTLSPARRQELAWQILAPLLPLLGQEQQKEAGDHENRLQHILALAWKTTDAPTHDTNTQPGGAEKRRQWQQFLAQAKRLLHGKQQALRALTPEALRTFMTDYRRITADLARGRSLGADPQTVAALNRLVVLGHNVLYGYLRQKSVNPPGTWLSSFPRAVRANLWAVLLSACWLFAPAGISYVAVQWYPEYAYDLVAEEFFEFAPSDQEHLHRIPSMVRPIFASAIVTNNVQVSLLAFGLGLTAGVGTCLVLVFNGMHLGAIAGWLFLHGHSPAFWGWIMPHGGTELLAIVLSGGAGLMLARAILAPGEERRAMALRRIAPQALAIVGGCMVMLVVAGIIEGFVSPSRLTYAARLAVLAASLCGWLVYLACVGLSQRQC